MRYIAIFCIIYFLCMFCVFMYKIMTKKARRNIEDMHNISEAEWRFWMFTPFVNMFIAFMCLTVLVQSLWLTWKQITEINFFRSIQILPNILFSLGPFSIAIMFPFYGTLVIQFREPEEE